MRTILLITFTLFLSVFAHSQTIVEKPKIGMSTAPSVNIEKIELLDSATVLWFHVNYMPGNWISVPKGSYIQPVGTKEKLFLVSADGIPVDEKYTVPASGVVDYKITFPKIEASTKKLDFGEANEGGSWFIYDIQLKPELYKSIVPEKIRGNWFRSDNAQWGISLLDSVAVYKSQVWKYRQYSEKNGTSKISLKSGTNNLDIYAKSINDSTSMIGETIAKLVKYTQQPNESAIPKDKEPFKLPVFKMDTITYCGYINGFSPRFPQHTGMVYVNDVLTGEQASYLLEIADDGTFKVKFLHSNPQGVFVRLPFSSETIFVEPGKTTFQLIDKGSKTNPVLFMGDCALINTELSKLKKINSFNYYEMLEKVLDFTPEQYKTWCQNLQKKDLEALASYDQLHHISAKAFQVKKMELDYRYSSTMFEYGWNIESAYRKKNKIPQDQREIPFKPARPDSSYYSFLTNELVNNPMAVLCSDYSSFINRLKFMEILRGSTKFYSLPEIAAEMNRAGYKLTPEQEELTIQMKGIDTPELKKIQDEFQQKYGLQAKEFQQKYAEKLKVLYNEKKGSVVTIGMMEEYLIGKNVEFTADEKAWLLAQKEFDANPLNQKRSAFFAQFNKAINQFQNDHKDFINGMYQKYYMVNRKENIQKVLGIHLGFATDIMASQDICRSIVAEMTPIADEKVKEYQKEITTPFIANYIELKNNETKATIKANKKLTGWKVNEVPKTAADNIFDAIIEKYKGKVVYVDFWATWCAPCRSGIERIKPLKDEMANEKVAFVYITSPSSPKTTYDNMIPTIKGEHYYVSNDEWNILCGKFNISGIPHYVLVGKDGKVINPQLGFLDNSQLKSILMKHIKE